MNLLQVALDVLQTIVRSSTLPLSAELVQSGFPAAARCVLQSDDNSTMQVCMKLLQVYVVLQTTFSLVVVQLNICI